MELKLLFIKLITCSAIGAIAYELTTLQFFGSLFYILAAIGVLYTVIIPKYKRDKKYKQWVKNGMKKEDRYKWEDIQ